MAVSIFQIYFDWLFNGDMKSPIPPEILKSTSPINQQYAISIFLGTPKLNLYLDQYFNNINLWYVEKDELFLFLKKCVKDFRVNRRNLSYISWNRTTKLFDELRRRIPSLKSYEINLLSEIIEKSEERDEIYSALSLENEKVKAIKQSKKIKSVEKETVEDFLSKNFKTMEIEQKVVKSEQI